jgi:hypothetical protein
LTAPESVTLKFSAPSKMVSSAMLTVMVCVVTPAANVSVPAAAV